MVMVGADNSSLKVDSQPKSIRSVWGSAATLHCLIFTEQTLTITLSRWQHHKHCPKYYYIQFFAFTHHRLWRAYVCGLSYHPCVSTSVWINGDISTKLIKINC